MIDEEIAQPATAERKQLLKNLADLRGAFAMATANLRAYLLNPDEDMKKRFDVRWAIVGQAKAAIEAGSDALTPGQRESWTSFGALHAEFQKLPAKLFEIRATPQWNLPVHILVTEAMPRAAKILDVIDGPKGADGTRAGGMKDRQQAALAQDAQIVAGEISTLETHLLVLLVIGVVGSGIIAFLTSRSIVTPVTAMTEAMSRLAAGDLQASIPARDRRDEIGAMANSVQIFKDGHGRGRASARRAAGRAAPPARSRRADRDKRRRLRDLRRRRRAQREFRGDGSALRGTFDGRDIGRDQPSGDDRCGRGGAGDGERADRRIGFRTARRLRA